MGKFLRSTKEAEQPGAKLNEVTSTADPPSAPELRSTGKSPANSEPSVIGPSLRINGNLETDAELLVSGKIEGDIKGKTITIGEGAEVTGSIYGETVKVAGKIQGKIEARTVVVSKTAHTTGDIIHASLQIEAGAYVDGHCRPEFGKGDHDRASFPKPTAIQSVAGE